MSEPAVLANIGPKNRRRIVQSTAGLPPDVIELPPDAWRAPRAAAFLGVSEKTIERWAAKRIIPGMIVYPPAREDEATPGGKKGTKPIIAFDPVALARFRASFTLGIPKAEAR